jgi:hypothetical protein
MNPFKNLILSSLLLAVVIAGPVCATMKEGPRTAPGAVAQSPQPASARSAPRSAGLANGVYAVLKEGATREAADSESGPHTTLVYDQKYSEADRDTPPRYIALGTSSFVPLILAEPPEARKDDRGFTLLNVRLAPDQAKRLEEFTRTHLNGQVAIVIGGEIITMHKVRAVIEGGRVQITRCTDDACQVLKLKLTN